MSLDINYGKSVFTLPKDGVLDKLSGASENDLKILLLLCSSEKLRSEYPDCIDTLASECGISAHDVEMCVSFWRGADVLSLGKAKKSAKVSNTEKIKESENLQSAEAPKKALTKDEIPNYTGEELAKLSEKDGGALTMLIDECQNIVGKIFNPLEINQIVSLYDYLKLESEHIMLLCQYCRSKDKSSVHYIVKTAYAMYNEGVDTLEKFEAFLLKEEQMKDFGFAVIKILGTEGRKPTANESKSFSQWKDWKISTDMVKRAYDITVENTGKYSISYMNKVLSNWHDNGYETLEQVEKAEEAYKKSKSGFDVGSSFDTDDFYKAAIDRSYTKKD